jgi:hypothetical protein
MVNIYSNFEHFSFPAWRVVLFGVPVLLFGRLQIWYWKSETVKSSHLASSIVHIQSAGLVCVEERFHNNGLSSKTLNSHSIAGWGHVVSDSNVHFNENSEKYIDVCCTWPEIVERRAHSVKKDNTLTFQYNKLTLWTLSKFISFGTGNNVLQNVSVIARLFSLVISAVGLFESKWSELKRKKSFNSSIMQVLG